jgi:hypothetical protein
VGRQRDERREARAFADLAERARRALPRLGILGVERRGDTPKLPYSPSGICATAASNRFGEAWLASTS